MEAETEVGRSPGTGESIAGDLLPEAHTVREPLLTGPVLKVGDRVRVTAKSRGSRFQPGDRGIVIRGPISDAGLGPYYVVAMGEDRSGDRVVFQTDEIELDA